MSSLYRDDRSPYWTACFTAYVGQQVKQLKKTTATSNREVATVLAVKLQEAGRGACSVDQIKSFLGQLPDLRVRRAARRAFDDVLRLTTGTGLESRSTRAFVETWLGRTKGEVAAGTWDRYKSVADRFLEVLGGKAEQDIGMVRQEDIALFRDTEAKRVKPATANLALKILRILFNAAESARIVVRNEAKHVQLLKVRGQRLERRAFTLDELKRVLAVCNAEWRSLVLFGYYTGGRLGDLAALTWQNVNLERREVIYQSSKTGRVVILPMAEALQKHVEELPAGDDPKQPIHPHAYATLQKQKRVGALSSEFRECLVAAGLAQERTHKRDQSNKGRSGERKASDVSFHALRHTAVTHLKLAGVGEVVAMDLVGHDSAEVSRGYTHVDHATKLDAVNRLPVLAVPDTRISAHTFRRVES
ncbi:MAG: site-specific integrase [Proteobacteria bacterium]|nr:site-specific integrase [Pseudomonadota bacterium]